MLDQPADRSTSLTERLARRLPTAPTLGIAAVAGLAALAASYATAGFTPRFVVAPVASTLTDWMPAAVVTFAILVLGDLGQQLNFATAVVLSWLLLAAASLLGLGAAQWRDRRAAAPTVGGAATVGVAFAATGAGFVAVATGLAAGVVLGAAAALAPRRTQPGVSGDRRHVLGAAATALGIAFGGYAAGAGTGGDAAALPDLDVGESVEARADRLLADANEQSMDVDGLEGLVSEGFYTVDINSVDPTPDHGGWELSVTGAVDEERTYAYDDVTAMDAENRFVSLRCVSDPLNGKKLDTALWQGVPIMDLVEPANPSEGCCVMLRAADGFYEEFPLAALEDGFLAFGMNGEVLPRSHGFPARALIPGHWGEINVKWLTEIEVLEAEQKGYWEERGWHGTGPVNTVAKLHVVNELADGRKQVAGHAYAGTRGVERVEVSTDGGDTWADARLSDPLPGEDVWRQWVYEYDPPDQSHEVVVRATDGTGDLQPREESSPYPSGPTGWVSRTVNP